jgi:hypothetical protein
MRFHFWIKGRGNTAVDCTVREDFGKPSNKLHMEYILFCKDRLHKAVASRAEGNAQTERVTIVERVAACCNIGFQPLATRCLSNWDLIKVRKKLTE